MAFKTREQIEADELERVSRQVSAAESDQSKRESYTKKRVVITLTESPRERFAGGSALVSFTGTEPGRNSPLAGVYFVPEHQGRGGFDQDGLQARLGDLSAGDKLSMAGSWSKRQWKGQDGSPRETWEFKAQNFAKGEVSVEDMQRQARAVIGDARLDTLPVGEELPARDRGPDRTPAAAVDRPPASPTLSYASGNIVDDDAQVLVNTVNSQLSPSGNGVMGKGVALEFKTRFPSIMADYENAIRSGELKPGRALLFDLPDGRKWAALATKDDWRDKSQEGWVESGLKELGDKMRAAGLTSVALPPPGCGNGGLDWKRVEPMVHRHLGDGIAVSMYARPSGAMGPVAERGATFEGSTRGTSSAGSLEDSRRDAPSGRAPESAGARAVKSLAASLGRDAARSRGWGEDELIAMIPDLLSPRNGYQPYAGIGSRETTQDVCDDMTAMARVLEARGFTLRSGFAGGADTAFELGTTRDNQREIFAPWEGFGANPNSKYEKTRWDQIRRHEGVTGEKFVPAKARLLQGAMAAKAEELASAHHPHWERLASGARQLHSRNMGQVLGPKLEAPARFEMAWTVDGKATGGTGQAIRVAEASGIPVLNLHNPRIRAAVLKELGLDPVRNLERDLAVAAKERAAAEYRDRYDGMPMGMAARDARREETARFKQGEAPAGAAQPVPAEAQPARSGSDDGRIDLTRPDVRSRAKDDVAYFCKVADPLGSLSNMYNKAPIVVDGVTWKSSEALYQALRFPDNPGLQEAIRNESNAYTAKVLAHENKHLTRPDWDAVNEQAMAWVVTLKKDQSSAMRADLESTGGRDIVELSVKDDFWGAEPRGDQLVGRDVLGNILTQLRDGARMDEPPPGSMLLGRPIGRSAEMEAADILPEPSIKASMYFRFGNDRREGMASDSTFDAINAGERTSTTRFAAWGSLERWENLEPGSVVRFYEDKEMRGKSVDVVVVGTSRIDLARAPADEIRAWSQREGWSEKAGRDFGARYGEGVQVRYALPDSPEGKAALARSAGRPDIAGAAAERSAAPPARASQERPAAPARQAAQAAAMTAKQKWMASLA